MDPCTITIRQAHTVLGGRGVATAGGNGGYLPHHACFVLKRTGGGQIHFVLQDEVSTKGKEVGQ